jgi:hypothetical protein
LELGCDNTPIEQCGRIFTVLWLPREAMPRMTRVFICYRRDDTGGYAGRIYDRLVKEFGEKNIFMDIDTIPLGEDFLNVISQNVIRCNILVAVIGKRWLQIADAGGSSRGPEVLSAEPLHCAVDRSSSAQDVVRCDTLRSRLRRTCG